MNRIRYLALTDFQIIIEEYKYHFKEFDDPLPNLESCNKEKLESVIAIPEKTYAGRDLYPTIFDKAACYFYFINKFHPFYNGNKRMSVFVTNIFMMMNNYELTYSDDEIYNFAKDVTVASHEQTKHLRAIAHDLRKHSRYLNDQWATIRNTWYFVVNFFKRKDESNHDHVTHPQPTASNSKT